VKRPPHSSLVAIPLAAAALLVACGSPGKGDVERSIRGWAKAANERDAKRFCNDYVTQGFAERVSGATGSSARAQCEKLFKATRPGLKVNIIQIRDVKIDGDKATAVVRRQTTGTGPLDQVFQLKNEDGHFRIASSGER
jgi:ketosteroid isomerase-like protein